jgi:hypothetical protein
MAYHLSRSAARDLANYLSTYQSDYDPACDVASGLFALLNADEDSIVLVDDEPEDKA